MPRSTVVLDVLECTAETANAIQCVLSDMSVPDCRHPFWIPRSVIADRELRDASFKGDTDFELEIYQWFADNEDIPYTE